MREEIISALTKELKISQSQVQNTLAMLEEGDTVPFIARYRKEKTGGLDEEQILFIEKQYSYEVKLAERKEQVIRLISEQGKITPELTAQINNCTKLSQVEDLYRPYAQKKKTRAAVAIKNGLEPLSEWILSLPKEGDLSLEAQKYINENVKDEKDAIQQAKDIIAEKVSDNAQLRWKFKDILLSAASLVTKIKKDAVDENKVYEMYYDRSEKVSTLADHRIMAIDRAEKEKVITVSFDYDLDYLKKEALDAYVSEKCITETVIKEAVDDGLERLLLPSIEREIRSELSDKAQKASIELFSLNLEKLLLQAPLKGRVVLGFDPGFYNGCKLAVIDATGKMLTVDKIFPFSRKGGDIEGDKSKLEKMIRQYGVQIVAIGNGTASRESEKMVADLIREKGLQVSYAIVSEAGASVWSAQEEAREEFPDLAVEERSAVSIGRRILDPLGELIKIDPKSIGVGQYQHDLSEKELNERLDEVVMKCVNRVGADANTASVELLEHISGLNKSSAKEIVAYRNQNGRFTNREQLKKVKKIGAKTFEQCAGFIRIADGEEPLDATSIHPESYALAKEIMRRCGIAKLGQADIVFDKDKLEGLEVDSYTLNDIEEAIRQPLRDYRDQFDGALLKSDVLDISNLHVGDQLQGTVRNVVDFGAFVDIGLHEDGLVHITKMSRRRISHPSEVIAVGDIVTVYVYELDLQRNRVALSLLPLEEIAQRDSERQNNKGRKNSKNDRRQSKPKQKSEEEKMEDATKRLMERFSKNRHA